MVGDKSNKILGLPIILVMIMMFFSSVVFADVEPYELPNCIDPDGPNGYGTASYAKYIFDTDGTFLNQIRYDRCVGINVWEYYCPEYGAKEQLKSIIEPEDDPNNEEVIQVVVAISDVPTETISTDTIQIETTLTEPTTIEPIPEPVAQLLTAKVILEEEPIIKEEIINSPEELEDTKIPDISYYRSVPCDFGCSAGACIESPPGVEITGSFIEGDSLSLDMFSANCKANSIFEMESLTTTLEGFNIYNELEFFETRTLNCVGLGTACAQPITAHSDEPGFSESVPGNWKVTCNATDLGTNNNVKSKFVPATCTVCNDVLAPRIDSFVFEPLGIDKTWFEIIATDPVSGTNHVELELSYNGVVVEETIMECPASGCYLYRALGKVGNWDATVTVWDKSGNSNTETINYVTQ